MKRWTLVSVIWVGISWPVYADYVVIRITLASTRDQNPVPGPGMRGFQAGFLRGGFRGGRGGPVSPAQAPSLTPSTQRGVPSGGGASNQQGAIIAPAQNSPQGFGAGAPSGRRGYGGRGMF